MSDFTRINIALRPPASIRRQMITLSESLAKQGKSYFILDDIHFFPHITLYSPEYPTKNAKKVLEIIEDIAQNTNALEVQFTSIQHQQGYIGILLKPSDELINLHKKIVNGLNALREGHLREKYTLELSKYSYQQQLNIKKWGYSEVYSDFSPHITLTRYEDHKLAQKVAPTINNFSKDIWKIENITAFMMGDHGTCIERIKEFSLIE